MSQFSSSALRRAAEEEEDDNEDMLVGRVLTAESQTAARLTLDDDEVESDLNLRWQIGKLIGSSFFIGRILCR